jgi:phosphatidylglycerophosphatase C
VNGVAAFDFDGTLVKGDSLLPFLRRLCGPTALALAGARSWHEIVRLPKGGEARDVAKAAFLGRLLPGVEVARATALAEDYAATLEARLRPDMRAKLRWHQDEGHRVVIVSASPALYLDPFGRRLGLDAVLATGLVVGDDGCFTGELLGANCRGQEKARRLRLYLGDDPVTLWAYGDSPGDHEMLAMADHRVLMKTRRR